MVLDYQEHESIINGPFPFPPIPKLQELKKCNQEILEN